MATNSPNVDMVSIPVSDGSPGANLIAINAIKQNIENEHGFMGFVNRSKPHISPTAVNTATGAALRRVQATYP